MAATSMTSEGAFDGIREKLPGSITQGGAGAARKPSIGADRD